jgi:hypothetical protein
MVTETKTVSLSDPWTERSFKRHFEKDSLLVCADEVSAERNGSMTSQRMIRREIHPAARLRKKRLPFDGI